MNIVPSVKNFTRENSTTILTGASIAGLIGTAVLSARAAVKADRKVRDLAGENFPLKEKVKVVWPMFVPAALSGISTAACIIAANRIGLRRNAALMTAYTIAETTFRQYKDKVIEEVGKEKERKVYESVTADKIAANPPATGKGEVIVLAKGEQLCYDTLTGRYFRGDVEDIRKAENDINHQMLAGDMYASQNEFYDRIGLEPVDMGDELGWNLEHLLKLRLSSHLAPDLSACLAIGYEQLPIPNYGKCF